MGERKPFGFILRLLRSLLLIFTSYFAIIGVLVTILMVLLGNFIYQSTPKKTAESSLKAVTASASLSSELDQSILRIRLNGPLVALNEHEGDRFLSRLFGETRTISLQKLQTALRRAATDARVLAVLVEVSQTSGDFSSMTTLRRTLEEFKASKKPLYVSLEDGSTGLYYLASVADQISLSPVGGLDITGPAFQLTYFASALEKLGLQFEVIKAGKFKSAMESLTQDQPSAETLEMYGALESSLRGTVASAIAVSRKHTEAEVNAWLKRSLFTSQDALAGGLVDRVGYVPDWEEELKTVVKAKNLLDYTNYLRVSTAIDEGRVAEGDASLALIEAVGEIVSTHSSGREQISPDRLIAELKWAGKEDEIKAVVLRIDSPGGSALASDIIWDEVKKLNAKKPVVVSMGSVAASGGYYIAAPASLIVAEPTTITGSIGVIGGLPKGLKIAEKWGIHVHTVTASDRRDYLNFTSKSSEADKTLIQASIKQTYDTFVQKVAEGRKQNLSRIYEIAEGRVYSGADALNLGLVDRLGGFGEAVRAAKELAKLDPEKLYALQSYEPDPKNWLECVQGGNWMDCLNTLDESDSILRAVDSEIPQSLRQLRTLKQLLEAKQALVYWPFHLQWGQESPLHGLKED